MKSKKTVLLELGRRFIKVCQVFVVKKRNVIDHLEVFDFSRDITTQDLEEVCSRYAQTPHDEILFSLPRSYFLLRFLELPSEDTRELKRMAPFQLAKITPHPLEEGLYDFSLAQSKKGFSKLIVFLIQQKKAAVLLEFLEKKKLTPLGITISSWGLFRWIEFERNFFKVQPDSSLVVIDIDRYSAEFLVLNNEKILFSRSFLYAQDAELLQEINHSLRIFEKEFGKQKFAQVILTGNNKEHIMQRVDLGPVRFIPFGEHFSVPKEVHSGDAGVGFSFASLLGLSVNRKLVQFDFSPGHVKEKRERVQKKKQWLQVMFAGIELIALCGIFLFKYSYDKYAYLKFLDSKVKEITVEAEELDEISDQLKVFEKRFKNKVSFAELLYRLVSVLPPHTQLTLLDVQTNGEFSLKGNAENVSDVFEVATHLNRVNLFSDVKVRYASKVKRQEKTIIEFFVSGRVRK